jgi:hypothetical protein
MNPTRFDRISKLFAARHTRRQLMRDTGLAAGALAATGLGHAAAQDATPEPGAMPEAIRAEPWTGEKISYLYVQSFQGGSITPTDGAEGRYTVTLEQGTGQTIYFADRPSRDVGTRPTPQFLEGLGFPEDNPPNAALIVKTETGETDIAVVKLFNPTYDPETRGVTYDVEVLESWQEDLELGLREEPTDLAALAPAFGSAHLLIDDCPALSVYCRRWESDGWSQEDVGYFWDLDACDNYALCMPCEPYGHDQPDRCATYYYWTKKCNDTFAGCGGVCWAGLDWPLFGTGC